jgi:hypothetical protein
MTISYNIPTQTVSMELSIEEVKTINADAREYVTGLFKDTVAKLREDISKLNPFKKD